MSFGEKIKKLRKQKGWSLNKLGEQAGLQGRIIGKYESGKVAPTANSIIKLATAFNVTTDFLLFDQIDNKDISPNIQDNILLKLFENLEKMEDKDKETIISVINAFIEKNKIK